MSKIPLKGVVMFAENNEQLSYTDMAHASALMVKEHMGVGTTLITNVESLKVVDTTVYDKVITIDQSSDQKKQFVGYGRYEKLSYLNSNRTRVHDLTPYEETIMLDVDYLILDDTLNKCWGSLEDVLMSHCAIDVLGNNLPAMERRLSDTTIPMYWATVVYFNKSEKANAFFTIVKNVQKNYLYYTQLFETRSEIYRNDFAYSIAAHLLGECQDGFIKPTYDETLITSLPTDIILNINKGKIDFLAKEGDWHFPVQMTQNFHYMNKFDLAERAQEIIKVYE